LLESTTTAWQGATDLCVAHQPASPARVLELRQTEELPRRRPQKSPDRRH